MIAANPDRFEVVGVGAGGGNLDLLRKQVADLGLLAGRVAVADESAGRDLVAGIGAGARRCRCDGGSDRCRDGCGAERSSDRSVWRRVWRRCARRPVALANKESLVAGGALVLDAAAQGRSCRLILETFGDRAVFARRRVPASVAAGADGVGGPFRGWSREDVEHVTRSRRASIRRGQWGR